ncbi:tripartite tricarboxylate transporter TctB family protein [Microbaculum marinum]|uniref:Tripartite tricarboxylate transporter TctB family protein n=1 Tax=Microbaculum marinum TaxID=1764581 RepID=A0AAW9RUK8_9HYPH
MELEPTGPHGSRTVPRYARVDVIGGAVMVFIAGLIWYGAIGLAVGNITNFGPGAMPRVLAGILLLAGGAVLVHGLFQRPGEAEPLTLALRPPLILTIAIFLFALFIRGGDFWFLTTPRFGIMVVGPSTVLIAGLATPEANLKELLVLAFGLTAAALLVFSDLLGVPIPVFPRGLENMIPPSFGLDAAVRVLYLVYGSVAAAFYVIFFGVPEALRG